MVEVAAKISLSTVLRASNSPLQLCCTPSEPYFRYDSQSNNHSNEVLLLRSKVIVTLAKNLLGSAAAS